MLCPTSKDICDTTGAWGASKELAISAGTSKTVTLGAVTDKQACSYIVKGGANAPFFHLDGAATSAEVAKLTFTVYEWTNEATAATYLNDGTVFDGWTGDVDATQATLQTDAKASLVTKATLTKWPVFVDTYTDSSKVSDLSTVAQNKQLIPDATFGVVKHYYIKGTSTNEDPVNPYYAYQAIKARNDEVKLWETAKAAFDTKKTDYDTKLAAAEKIIDAEKADIFKAWFPAEADKTTKSAVPERPSTPTAPPAWAYAPGYAVKAETTATN